MGQRFSFVLFIGVPLCQSCITGLACKTQIQNWYKKLKKPKWNPPTWVYPPLDFVLQTCVGIASWLIWRKGGFVDQRIPLTLYGIQLALTAIWTPLFFNAHKVKLAFAELVVLDVVTTATALQFYDQSKTAGYLMTPFLAFLVFETARILRIAIDNPDADKIEEQESVKESVSIQTPHGTPSVDHNSASGLVPDHVRAEPPAVAGTSKVEEAKKTN